MTEVEKANLPLHLAFELDWLMQLIKMRINLHTDSAHDHEDFAEPPPPSLPEDNSEYARFVNENGLSIQERIVLILSMAPYLKPHLLEVFNIKSVGSGRGFTEFGGQNGSSHRGFLPTAETALFLLAGDNLIDRLPFHALFDQEHIFATRNILHLSPVNPSEPYLSGVLVPSREVIEKLTLGDERPPAFSPSFPAKRMQTTLEWDDLVLGGDARKQVAEIKLWLQHKEAFLGEWGMSRQFKPGYSALFHGPPGTGKTMTASLLGKATTYQESLWNFAAQRNTNC
jgi:hypothetical protein